MYDAHTTYSRGVRCGDVVAPRFHSTRLSFHGKTGRFHRFPPTSVTAWVPSDDFSGNSPKKDLVPFATSLLAHRKILSAHIGPDRAHHFAFTRAHLDRNLACPCPPRAGHSPQRHQVRRYLRRIASWRRTVRTPKHEQDPEKLARAQKETLPTFKKAA